MASPVAGGNAAVSLSTNATGGALVLTITNPGSGFFLVNATPNVAITNATGGSTGGSGATFTAVAGGRAGRVSYETLVAMGSLGTNTTTSTGVTGPTSVVADASTDNAYFPGV